MIKGRARDSFLLDYLWSCYCGKRYCRHVVRLCPRSLVVKVGWNEALRLLYRRQTSSNSLCLWWSKWKKRGRGLIWYPGAILSGKVPGGHLTSRLDLSGLTSLSPPSSVPLHDNISGLCPLFCSRGERWERDGYQLHVYPCYLSSGPRYHHNKRIEIGNDTVRVLLIFSINIVLTGLVIVTGLGWCCWCCLISCQSLPTKNN